MPPLPQSNACSLCDRPTDRPTDGSMNHLPSASHKNLDPPRTGWVFCSPEKHTGQGSLSPFLSPSESMGARPSQPGALEGAGKGKREKAEPERAKRTKSYRAAGSRKPRGFVNSEKRIRSQEVEKSESWKVGKSKSWLETPGMRTLTSL